MLKINNRGEEIQIAGDSETLKDEIATLMLTLCGEAAKRSEEAALDVYRHYLETIASIAAFLKAKHHIDISKFLEEEEEAAKKPVISEELDDAIETFFSALDEIIAKKKGDK